MAHAYMDRFLSSCGMEGSVSPQSIYRANTPNPHEDMILLESQEDLQQLCKENTLKSGLRSF
jgi:hypothetical protein